jgi:uncharacterized protein YbbC (DUF1343 family)
MISLSFYQLSKFFLVNITAVFGPEHGFRGDVQDGQGDPTVFVDAQTGLTVYSTYGMRGPQLVAQISLAGVDTLVFDIQDVGTRFYTYIWTLWDCMSAAAQAGVRKFVVLDRPNPINGISLNGNVLDPAFSSFIGRLPIALRHGMTVCELASMFYHEWLPASDRVSVKLVVQEMEGWQRAMYFEDTGLLWVPPSPNMPTEDTALVYPGLGLLEGTNLSEGRGTTRPFEQFGAPFFNWTFTDALNTCAEDPSRLECRGCQFREIYYTPTFSKWQGNITCGAQIYVLDSDVFDPVAVGLEVVATALALAPANFSWVDTSGNNFDLHMGTNETRLALMQKVPVETIMASWKPQMDAFLQMRSKYLMY